MLIPSLQSIVDLPHYYCLHAGFFVWTVCKLRLQSGTTACNFALQKATNLPKKWPQILHWLSHNYIRPYPRFLVSSDWCASPGPAQSECQWGPWGGWSLCSISCGEGGVRSRVRLLTNNGFSIRDCSGQDREVASCPVYSCPRINTVAPTGRIQTKCFKGTFIKHSLKNYCSGIIHDI